MKEANDEIWYSQPITNVIYEKAMHEKMSLQNYNFK